MYGMNPYGYTPYGAQNLYTPNMNPTMPNMPMQNANIGTNMGAQSGMEIVPVPTIQQVEQVGLQPGQRKIVMVQNAPIIAMRAADQVSGLIETKYYNLVEFVPGAQATPQMGDFVTRKEFNDFVESLKAPAKKEESK